MDEDLLWTVEQACANAWPSPRQILLDCWLLRLSGGPTRRTNSVNPLRAPRHDLTSMIDRCAEVYAAAGQPLIVRAPSIAVGLADSLDRIGFVPRLETRTLLADLSSLGPVPEGQVELTDRAGDDWIAFRAHHARVGASGDAVYRAMLECIALPRCFAALRVDGEIVSAAYGVLDRGLLVVESVRTADGAQGRGYAKRVVGRLMRWAAMRGADKACLQVQADNGPARALYASLGFGTDLYGYHYHYRPEDAPA